MDLKNRLRRYSLVVLGTLVLSFATKLFVIPGNLLGTGGTGISLAMNHYFGIPVPVFAFIFNMTMLVLAWWLLGKKFAITTVFCSVFYPVLLAVLDEVLGEVHITDNMMLNAIYAGMGVGLAIGLVVHGGGCTGGTDPISLIMEKYFRVPVAVTVWIVDIIVLGMQAFYHPLEDLLYGVLLVMAITITLDKVLLMGKSKTEVKIISEFPDKIRDAIMEKVDRGVTMLHGEGGYLHHDTEVVMTVVATKELVKIERLAREVDPACFVIVNRVTEVWGKGFTAEKKRIAK